MMKENYEILSAQRSQLREVAELRRDGASELIRVEIPERGTMGNKKIQYDGK